MSDEEQPREHLDHFDVLGVADNEGAYASLIAWILDPKQDHGLGSALLDQLQRFLEVLGVEFSCTENFSVKVRVNEENCGIILSGDAGHRLVVILRLSPGEQVLGLDEVRAAGVPVVGLAYGPSAFPSASQIPVWRLQALAEILRDVPNGRFSRLLKELRRRLERGRNAMGPAPLSAAETFIRSQLETDNDLTQAEGIGAEMLVSDDMSRAYILGQEMGVGGQGAVYSVGVQGNQYFEGFANPTSEAVIKVAHVGYEANLRREGEVLAIRDPGFVQLLDQGSTGSGSPFLILERLHRLPHERILTPPDDLIRIVSVDVFVNLLQTLHELHFRKSDPLVLCDIKPDNVLLRLPGHCELDDDEYEALLYEHSYEPVFVDVGCAQDLHALQSCEGRLPEMIGTPAYLPPESIPILAGSEVTMGVYSRKTDVYSLTLTFYTLLTGARPYMHHASLQGLAEREYLLELFELKRQPGVLAYDPELVSEKVGEDAAPFVLEVLAAGLAPDPASRPSARVLLKTCERLFGLNKHRQRADPYLFDGPVALRQRQSYFSLDSILGPCAQTTCASFVPARDSASR